MPGARQIETEQIETEQIGTAPRETAHEGRGRGPVAPTGGPTDGAGPGGGAGAGGGADPGASDGTGGVLDEVAERLARVVESFAPERFSGTDAERLLDSFVRIERLALCGKTMAATRAAEAQAHRAHGHKSPAHWLAEHVGEPVGEAMGTLAIGEALIHQPQVDDAFRSGKLSKSQARAVTDAVSTNPRSADELLSVAGTESVGQLRARCAAKKAETRSAEDEAARIARLHRRRSLRTWTDPTDGCFRLDARLTPETGARLLTALKAEAEAHFDLARHAGTTEPAAARLADALVALVTGQPNGTGSGTRGGDSVHIRVDLTALRRGQLASGEVCEIPGVGPVPVATALDVLGDALLRLVITDGVDVTTVATLSRHIPAAVRAALLERDPVCVVPGCDQAQGLEIDHWKIGFAAHGPTAWWNLVRICRHHHRLKTTGGFRLEGGPGAWAFVPPDQPINRLRPTTKKRRSSRAGTPGAQTPRGRGQTPRGRTSKGRGRTPKDTTVRRGSNATRPTDGDPPTDGPGATLFEGPGP